VGNKLKFNDVVSFSLTNRALIKVKDDYYGAFKPSNEGEELHGSGLGTQEPGAQDQSVARGLLVRIAATHSGIITRNNGFYLPDKMSKGAPSFTEDYGKPLLLHHNDREDSIGRIVKADYIDTSGALHDNFDLVKGIVVKDRSGRKKGVINELLIKDFCEGRMPHGMQVDTVVSLFRDSVLLEDEGYSGLGFIQLVGDVVDPEAIQKLMDGRYLTGSVGATTDQAICSVCRQDWTEGGPCEHQPGALYDGAKCFIIAGRLDYDEYSFVNAPADRHSKVLELHYNDSVQKIEIAQDFRGPLYEVQLSFPQYDEDTMQEETKMAGKKKKAEVVDQTQVQDSVEEEETPKPADEEVQATDEQIEEVEDAVETDADFLTRVFSTLSEKLTEEDEPRLYDLVIREMVPIDKVSEEELGDNTEGSQDDSSGAQAEFVATAEQRGAFPLSVFCGPNRSFPVPDEFHYRAVLRFVDRHSEVIDLSILKGNVERKGRAHGWKLEDATSTEAKPVDHKALLAQVQSAIAGIDKDIAAGLEETPFEGDDLEALKSVLIALVALVGKENITNAVVANELAVAPSCEQALADEVVRNEETICELRDELDALRKEYNSLFKDMDSLQDAHTEFVADSRKMKERFFGVLKVVKEGSVSETDFTKLSDADLSADVERLERDVDMTKIADKLGDGMSRVPTETVESPLEVSDNAEQNTPTNQKRFSPEEKAKFQNRVYRLVFSGKQGEANSLIDWAIAEGHIEPNMRS